MALDLTTDVLILAFVILILYEAKMMALRKKVDVFVVFIFILVTMGCAVTRGVSVSHTAVIGGPASAGNMIFWCTCEGLAAIIVGCLPSFAFLWRRKVKRTSVSLPLNEVTI